MRFTGGKDGGSLASHVTHNKRTKNWGGGEGVAHTKRKMHLGIFLLYLFLIFFNVLPVFPVFTTKGTTKANFSLTRLWHVRWSLTTTEQVCTWRAERYLQTLGGWEGRMLLLPSCFANTRRSNCKLHLYCSRYYPHILEIARDRKLKRKGKGKERKRCFQSNQLCVWWIPLTVLTVFVTQL